MGTAVALALFGGNLPPVAHADGQSNPAQGRRGSGATLASSNGSSGSAARRASNTEVGRARARPSTTEETNTLDPIVVTGSAYPERRFNVSYAVNSLSAKKIKELAPSSYSDLLGEVPGIQVESTGGDAENVTRVRGIPGDRTGLIVEQDGLPLWPQTDGLYFNSTDGMNRFDLMTERVEIVRGGPAPIYASSATAIANNITVSGGPVSKGAAELTLGDTGLYRGDVYQSGPLSDSTFYAIGGFIRYNDGYRDNGFPNDRGGQIRGNIKHVFANGWVKVSAQYMDDINVFYLPIPIADPRNPSVSLNPYINYFTGTLNSPSMRDVGFQYYDQNGVLQSFNRDLANGRHIKFGNVGLDYEGDFNGTTVDFKSSLTKGTLTFDAFYSTSNPVDGNAFAASYLTAARTAFGSAVDHLGYTIAGVPGMTVYNPSSDSGLVMQGQYRAVNSGFYSDENDLSATHRFKTIWGTHDVKIGVNGAFWGLTGFDAYQNYLVQVRSQPQLLNLVAYSSSGAVLGDVTNNGVLQATTGLNQMSLDAKSFALYLNDTWAVTDKLRFDAGIRTERYDYIGTLLVTASRPLPGPSLAGSYAVGFTGAVQNIDVKPTATNWTVGVNYDFTDSVGVYGRASELTMPPQLGSYTSYPVGSTEPSKAYQYEVGLKTTFRHSYLYLTGFLTNFNPLNASFQAFNPQTGGLTNVSFLGTARTEGVEADGNLHIGDLFAAAAARDFSLFASVTVANPEYQNFSSVTGASAAAIMGKQIVREPKIYGHVGPVFDINFDSDMHLRLYATYEYVGKRYVDVLNTTELPSYGTLGAGAIMTRGDWQAQVVGDNLTDAHGLTEGNVRSDELAGQGTPTAIYGRPLFGRSFRVMVTKKW
ncbi:MAG TPA: TonB-dependent receptor [Steroidobacteraceae bacterium]|nr:TonB-dependent receptor [Steroidobacteraceae bacterium]